MKNIQTELLKYLVENNTKKHFLLSILIKVFANFRLDFRDDQWYNLCLNVFNISEITYMLTFSWHITEKIVCEIYQ